MKYYEVCYKSNNTIITKIFKAKNKRSLEKELHGYIIMQIKELPATHLNTAESYWFKVVRQSLTKSFYVNFNTKK